jgi:hypothetical protein
MRTITILSAVMLTIVLLWPSPARAQSNVSVTGAAGGIYPPGTTFNGIPINGLKTGFGVVIASDGSASGQFHTLLLGISLLGKEQNISVNGNADTGSQTAENVATFSGKCTIDMGDGSPPTPGVPFTVTVTTNASDQGSLGLVLGLTTLPDATINSGSMNIIK